MGPAPALAPSPLVLKEISRIVKLMKRFEKGFGENCKVPKVLKVCERFQLLSTTDGFGERKNFEFFSNVKVGKIPSLVRMVKWERFLNKSFF